MDFNCEMINGLDLFSGIGGLTKALGPWVSPVAYCESAQYAQAVLLSRMHGGELPLAPIWDDIQTLHGSTLPSIEIIYGGFPCQDISCAGHGKGLEGERSGLFFEILRLAKEIKPKFLFLENVPAIRLRGLNTVGEQLADAGYDCRWGVISAAEMGAPHIRKRWFLLAHANSEECTRLPSGKKKEESLSRSFRENVSNSESTRQLQCGGKQQQENRYKERYIHQWEVEPSVGRVVDGIPSRVDRVKSLGNAVVPKQAEEAFKILMGIK